MFWVKMFFSQWLDNRVNYYISEFSFAVQFHRNSALSRPTPTFSLLHRMPQSNNIWEHRIGHSLHVPMRYGFIKNTRPTKQWKKIYTNTQGSEWKAYVNAVLRMKIVAYKLPFKKQRKKMELWTLSSIIYPQCKYSMCMRVDMCRN